MQRFPARIRQIEGNRPITTPSFFSKRSRPPWKEGRLCIIMGKKMGAYAPVAAGAAGRGNNHLEVQSMANTNRVKVDILGSSYFITTTESEEYIHGLEDSLNEMLGQLLERVSGQRAAISPQELLHVQQLVGMLNVQAKVGVQTSQQTTQGLEGLLRQSG